jgi:Spy/CpxP family protein refolding chaperone
LFQTGRGTKDPREIEMKKLIGMTVLGLAVGAIPVATQAEGSGRGPRDGQRGRRGQAVVEYLGLTAEQQQKWAALEQQHREAMKQFHEEGRALRQRLEESLAADEPDVAVGEAAKALHAHREATRQARTAFKDQLTSILTADQKVKFEAFEAARGVGRRGGRGHGHRGGGGGGAPAPVED